MAESDFFKQKKREREFLEDSDWKSGKKGKTPGKTTGANSEDVGKEAAKEKGKLKLPKSQDEIQRAEDDRHMAEVVARTRERKRLQSQRARQREKERREAIAENEKRTTAMLEKAQKLLPPGSLDKEIQGLKAIKLPLQRVHRQSYGGSTSSIEDMVKGKMNHKLRVFRNESESSDEASGQEEAHVKKGHVGPTTSAHVGPTKKSHVGPTTAAHVGPTTKKSMGPTTAAHVGPTPASIGKQPTNRQPPSTLRQLKQPRKEIIELDQQIPLITHSNQPTEQQNYSISPLNIPTQHQLIPTTAKPERQAIAEQGWMSQMARLEAMIAAQSELIARQAATFAAQQANVVNVASRVVDPGSRQESQVVVGAHGGAYVGPTMT